MRADVGHLPVQRGAEPSPGVRHAQARARLQEPVQVRDGGGTDAEREPPEGSLRREVEQQYRLPLQPRLHRQPVVSAVCTQGEHIILHTFSPRSHVTGKNFLLRLLLL